MKIYTKTGDSGETGLVGGSRISKDSVLMEAIGTVDELNAAMGGCALVSTIESLAEPVEWVQNWLFDLGAELATPKESPFDNSSIGAQHVGYLEESIDLLTEELPELKNFILPGGNQASVAFHIARSVCRRAERRVLELHRIEAVRAEVLAFLNRLSDWLFVAARTANHVEGLDDVPWAKSDWS